MSHNFPLSAITNKDLRAVARDAHQRGWNLTLTNGNHVRWTAPNGNFFISAATPRSSRSAIVARNHMRKLEAGNARR